MYEAHHQPLAPVSVFVLRLLKSLCWSILIITIAVAVGTYGYHYFESLPWVDSFLEASMILASMGPISHLNTTGGKLFAAFYALFSGLVFISIMSIMLTPIMHRIMHKMHIKMQ